MKDKRNLLDMPSENLLNKVNECHDNDRCGVCDNDLYHNEKFTKRIGLVDGNDRVCGWLCPYCNTEFDIDGRVVVLYGDSTIRGEA